MNWSVSDIQELDAEDDIRSNASLRRVSANSDGSQRFVSLQNSITPVNRTNVNRSAQKRYRQGCKEIADYPFHRRLRPKIKADIANVPQVAGSGTADANGANAAAKSDAIIA